MASKGGREKIKLASTAGTGHFYTTTKNKKTMPEKMSIIKFDPKARKHVEYKGNQTEVIQSLLLQKNRLRICAGGFLLPACPAVACTLPTISAVTSCFSWSHTFSGRGAIPHRR